MVVMTVAGAMEMVMVAAIGMNGDGVGRSHVEEKEKEDPEEDPREPTEEIEEDPEEDSEHGPNMYEPRDGGVMHMENEPIPTSEEPHSEYGFIGFDEREDSNSWKSQESPEYHPVPYYDVER
uniref:Uncharacterized protein n=1 Tax=Solanum tuberosum TaxID=4113 RepID=M1DC16_SOLTU